MTRTHNFKVGDKVVDNKGTLWEVIETEDNSGVPYHCRSTEGGSKRFCWFRQTGKAYTSGYYGLELVGLAEVDEAVQQPSNKAHKHKDLIIAYANGAEIEYYHPTDNGWYGTANPGWYEHIQYRIKSEPKPDVVKYVGLSFDHKEYDPNGEFGLANKLWVVDHFRHQLKLTFCGDTGKLKSAEVIS